MKPESFYSPDLPHDVSATQGAYLRLRGMILRGELEPGAKLRIETLRTLLNTGASPIREALSLLTSDLLVERIDQRGFRTTPTSQSNFEEILSLRCTLEVLALRESIERASDEWEEELVVCHHRMVRAQRDAKGDFEADHKTFHMTLIGNCASPTLLKYCSQIYDLNIRYRFIAGRKTGYERRDISNEHEGILEAATARDADLTADRLLRHYRTTGNYLNGLFAGVLSA